MCDERRQIHEGESLLIAVDMFFATIEECSIGDDEKRGKEGKKLASIFLKTIAHLEQFFGSITVNLCLLIVKIVLGVIINCWEKGKRFNFAGVIFKLWNE